MENSNNNLYPTVYDSLEKLGGSEWRQQPTSWCRKCDGMWELWGPPQLETWNYDHQIINRIGYLWIFLSEDENNHKKGQKKGFRNQNKAGPLVYKKVYLLYYFKVNKKICISDGHWMVPELLLLSALKMFWSTLSFNLKFLLLLNRFVAILRYLLQNDEENKHMELFGGLKRKKDPTVRLNELKQQSGKQTISMIWSMCCAACVEGFIHIFAKIKNGLGEEKRLCL